MSTGSSNNIQLLSPPHISLDDFAGRQRAEANEEDSPKSLLDISMLVSKEVGDRVRIYRKLAGLSQAELAKSANVTQVQVSRLEREPEKTRLAVFIRVSNALNKSLADLVEDIPVDLE